jgi:predicted ATPase
VSIPSLPGNPPALVGRERELGVLRQHLSTAISGHGSLVLIGGEAGVGKTALAEMLCREAAERGALILVGRAFELSDTGAYAPWLSLFESYLQNDGPPPPPAFATPGVVGEVTSQATLFRQVLDFLKRLSARQPLVLLTDDAQWYDPASLGLLRFLSRSIAAMPLLILVTYRDEDVRADHSLYRVLPLFVREANAERIALRPLDDTAVHTLVDARYGLAAPDADRLVAYLQRRAEGNALFVSELLRSIEEDGLLQHTDTGWALGHLTQTRVPPLLRQVIDARVSRLSEDVRHLFRVAAVVGHEVEYTVWAAVAAVDNEHVMDAVVEAGAAHLMREDARGAGATFVHALVRDAIYESIRPSQRRRWHQVAGEALAALPNPIPDAVAFHFQRAADARAVD